MFRKAVLLPVLAAAFGHGRVRLPHIEQRAVHA
jgi:hypothetical protein